MSAARSSSFSNKDGNSFVVSIGCKITIDLIPLSLRNEHDCDQFFLNASAISSRLGCLPVSCLTISCVIILFITKGVLSHG